MKFIAGLYRAFISTLMIGGFGIGALFIAFIVFNVIRLCVRDRHLRCNISRKFTLYSFKFYLKLGCLLKIFDIEIKGLEKIKNDKGVLYIANHPSLLDVVIMDSFVNNANCVVKASLKNNFFFSGVIYCNDYLLNSISPEMMIENCRKSLSYGDNIIIFPEGTRTVDFDHIKFRHGFASIALNCMCDIRPIVFKFDGVALRKGKLFYHTYHKILTYKIEVLDKIDINEFIKTNPGHERTALPRVLSNALQKTIQTKTEN
ncbi:MAG: 1-acyl-sn-glycerol-3-phosphate acyltransferase [Succinatimonas hippei]|uniref:lysophospholipid acyltransferase family protein n=1 Tax=Succinivibrio sp. TaxID=2053619 RepID=UPI003867AA25|nr:1-acyl-sn-glycerol-3-phosphate acyltransferase [Succinatimonas hippei]